MAIFGSLQKNNGKNSISIAPTYHISRLPCATGAGERAGGLCGASGADKTREQVEVSGMGPQGV